MDNPDGTGTDAGGGTGGGLMSGAAGALLPLALGAASFMNPKAGSQMLQSLIPMLNLQQQETAFTATERERKLTREQQAAKEAKARRASLATGQLVGLSPETAEAMTPGDILTYSRQLTKDTSEREAKELELRQRREASQILGAPRQEMFTPLQPAPEETGVEEALAGIHAPRPPATPTEHLSVLQKQLSEFRQRPMSIVQKGLPFTPELGKVATDFETGLKERIAQFQPPKPTALLPKDMGQGITDALALEVGAHPGATPAGVMAGLESPDPVARRDAHDIMQKTQQRARQTHLVRIAAEEQIKAREQANALMLIEPAKARALIEAQQFARVEEKALNYVDPKTLQPPSPSMTIDAANKAVDNGKLLIMPRGAIGHQGLRELVDAVQIAYDARRLGEKIFTSDSFVLLQQGKLTLQAFLQTNPDAVTFKNMMEGRMFRLARGLGSDSRISDKDAEIVLNALPGLASFKATKTVFKQGIDEMENVMVGGLKRYLALPPDATIPALERMKTYRPSASSKDVDLLERTLEAEKRRGR